MRLVKFLVVLCGAGVLGACDLTDVCGGNTLTISYTPRDTTIAVGQTFTPQVRIRTCGNANDLDVLLRWLATDTTIVRTDSLQGTTTGRKVGQTTLQPVDRGFYNVKLDPVTVRVR